MEFYKTQITLTREEIINLKNQAIPYETQNKINQLVLTKQETDQ